MAAGSVAAPLIIPLQPRRTGNRISGSTPVSIRSDGALVLFTLDGSRPDAGGCRYTAPVLLPAGKVAVRAMAATRDGRRSAVVTKEFWVDPREDEAPGTGPGPGGPGPGPAGPAGPGPGGPGPAGPGPGPGPPGPAGPGPAEPPAGARFLSARFGSQTSLSGPAPSSSGPAPSGSGPAPSSSGPAPSGSRRQDGGRHGALPPPDPEGTRLQRDELLRCAGCPVAPSDPRARFCVQCGAEVQKLPPAGTGQLWVCVCCGGVNPAAVSRCLTCESRPQPAPPAALIGCAGPQAPPAALIGCAGPQAPPAALIGCAGPPPPPGCPPPLACRRCGAAAPPARPPLRRLRRPPGGPSHQRPRPGGSRPRPSGQSGPAHCRPLHTDQWTSGAPEAATDRHQPGERLLEAAAGPRVRPPEEPRPEQRPLQGAAGGAAAGPGGLGPDPGGPAGAQSDRQLQGGRTPGSAGTRTWTRTGGTQRTRIWT
ncbi:double zinc ribbon and ankyrin repeat-containing protein 1 isoform 2-T2 [Menidia menidia]